MTVRRIVPNHQVESQKQMETSRDFYGLLGFETVMTLFSGGDPRTPEGWVTTMASPANPTAQISFFTEERTGPVVPDLSVEVEDVDAVYARVVASGAEVVHEIRDEEWGVRRFFVRDPGGRVVNVLSHLA
ncbi:catechol 2,3-dioxygenase-like lactoylglutathione lyase family enzyme [Streptomyces sp. V4I8]|uniref:VOC family protein n=1 Tax=Streptomyces sp. V4I8 TaxID=3156469 RepID=UPI003517BD58